MTPSAAVTRVLAALPSAKPNGSGWVARCPAHEDKVASLSVAEGREGRVLLRCHAGCEVRAIVAALGLRMTDLFAPKDAAGDGRARRRIVATYDYVDEAGALLYQVVRFEPKGFSQRRPVRREGLPDEWAWGLSAGWYRRDDRGSWRRLREKQEPNPGRDVELPEASRDLYRLPDLLAAKPSRSVVLVEGEKDVHSAEALGLLATTSPQGAGKWRPEFAGVLRGRKVYIVADKDDPGRKHAAEAAASLLGVAAYVAVVEMPGESVKDLSDWVEAGGTRETLVEMLKAAPPWSPSAPAAAPLAAEAPALAPAPAIPVPPAVPVDGAALLDEIAALVRRYVVLPALAADALALWVLGAHAFAAWECFASLGLTSPTKRCGKTRALTVLGALVPEPLHAANATAATIFRAIQKWRPTLLLDEAETVLNKREADPELRGILNAGHTRAGAVVLRCAPQTHEVQRFSVWAPRAYALIGDLPSTLRDRSILIALRRRRATDPTVPRMRQRTLDAAAEPLRNRAAQWAAAHADALRVADPDIPGSLDDRAADGWASLLAVADAVGGAWPARARSAAVALSASRAEDETEGGDGVEALRDLAAAFGAAAALPSVALVGRLNADPDAPWRAWHGGQGLTPADLARLLRPFGIRPRTVRLPDGSTPKGYHAQEVADALAPYHPASEPPHPPQSGLHPSSPSKTQSSGAATTPLVAAPETLVNEPYSPRGGIVADVAADRRCEGVEAQPPGPCRMCGGVEWWGPEDALRCAKCHPPATQEGRDERCPCCGGTGILPDILAWGSAGEVQCPVCRPAEAEAALATVGAA